MLDLQKALTTASGSPQLWQEQLNPQIYNVLMKELPLLEAMGIDKATSPIHQYRKRTSLPTGWVQGELSDADFRSATYEVKEVALKIVRSWGGVSSYAQGLTAQFVNQLQEQVNASVLGLANTLEWLLYYGNTTADSYQFNGIESAVNNDTTAKQALSSGGSNYNIDGNALTLSHLDTMLDRAMSYRGSSGDKWMFLMSKPLISRVSALQTRVTRTVTDYQMEGGFRMKTYLDIPLMPTQLFTPSGTSTSPTLSGSIVAGGTLTAGGYYYAIASVTMNGEQKASAATSVLTTATTNLTVRLTWTADANAKNYKIFRGTTNVVADMSYIATIPALTYDGSGNISGALATWDDTGANTANTAIQPLTSTDEVVALINVSAGERGNRMVGGVSPLGENMADYFSYVPLATTNGSYRFMMEGFLGLRCAYPECNIIARGARAA